MALLLLLLIAFVAIGLTVFFYVQLQTTKQKLVSVSERIQGIVDADAELVRVKAEIAKETALAKANAEVEAARVQRETSQTRADAEAGLSRIKEQIRNATTELTPLRAHIDKLRMESRALEEQADLHEFGFYKPQFDFPSTTRYEVELEQLRRLQKTMLQNKQAATCSVPWTVGGSQTEGRKFIDQTLRLQLRAFNGECDAAIARVRYDNVKVMEARIIKARETINKLAAVQQCAITPEYYSLKLKELYLVHEYQEKVQELKEFQRISRERIREEEIAQRELDRAKEEAQKEESRYQSALEKARREVEGAVGVKHEKLVGQIADLERRLADAKAAKERAISRAQMTKTGYVYITSNIGSFGEHVYKIGMTRRLDPMDRVRELGDASVPFPFDVHAMIYTEDAPALENALHRAFTTRRLNRVNERKEFFRVPLSEIAAVAAKHNAKLELTPLAEAKEYRQTLAMSNVTSAAPTTPVPAPFVLSSPQTPTSPPAAPVSDAIRSQLSMLDTLRDQGTITAAEYEARKSRLSRAG